MWSLATSLEPTSGSNQCAHATRYDVEDLGGNRSDHRGTRPRTPRSRRCTPLVPCLRVPRLPGQLNRWKCRVVERLEGPTRCRAPIAGLGRPRSRSGQLRPMRSEACSRRRALREGRSIVEHHHRCTIDCRWTTTSIRSRSTPYSRWASSSSKALVHQRRRVGGDHPGHVPGRMSQGLLGVTSSAPRQSAEGPAAGGQDQPVDLPAAPPRRHCAPGPSARGRQRRSGPAVRLG